MPLRDLRFALAWTLPLAVGVAAWHSPWAAWATVLGYQVGLASVELIAPRWTSPAAASASRSWFAWCLRLHVLWQAALLALGAVVAQRVFAAHESAGWAAIIALGLGVGGVTGSQGITFAHELGHSKARFDRVLAWLLMASVLYAHFMVEHYRGHHPRAATLDDFLMFMGA